MGTRAKIKTPIPRVIPNVLSRDLDGRITLLSASTKHVYTLTGISADVWRKINGKTTQEEMVRLFSKKYKIEPKLLNQLIGGLLKKLKKEKLIAL